MATFPKTNINHWASLVIGIVGWILGWYSLVLVTARTKAEVISGVTKPAEDKFPKKPTNLQYYGLIFAIGLAVLSWLQRLYAVQGEDE